MKIDSRVENEVAFNFANAEKEEKNRGELNAKSFLSLKKEKYKSVFVI